MQNTYKGYWSIVKGKIRILVHPGQSNPYKPTSFIYNTDPPCKSKADFYEIRKAVRFNALPIYVKALKESC